MSKTNRRRVYTGRVITVDLEDVRLPNGVDATLEIVGHPGGAAIVALDAEQRICLLRQYRHVAGGWVREIPAGKLDGVEPARKAREELAEEAGMQAARWDSLGRMLSSPGVFEEVVHLYLARELTPCGARPEHDEVIEIEWIPLAEAVARAHDGRIEDAKSVIAILRAAAWLVRAP